MDKKAGGKHSKWNNIMVNQLLQWEAVCAAYNQAHEKSKRYYNNKFKLLSYPNIVLTVAIAIIGGISTNVSNDTLNIVSAIIGGLLAGTNLYLAVDQPTEKMARHSTRAQGYREIVLKIQAMLAMSPEMRGNANHFVEKIKYKMLGLEAGEDSLPIITIEELNKLHIKMFSNKQLSPHSVPDKIHKLSAKQPIITDCESNNPDSNNHDSNTINIDSISSSNHDSTSIDIDNDENVSDIDIDVDDETDESNGHTKQLNIKQEQNFDELYVDIPAHNKKMSKDMAAYTEYQNERLNAQYNYK